MYDVVIIGAGPCGLMVALELCKKYKVCIIEQGNDIQYRNCKIDSSNKCNHTCEMCNVITGFGGSQFFDGTKLCYFPAGSGLLQFESKEIISKYYEYVEKILNEFGKEPRTEVNPSDIKNLIKEFENNNINVKYYNAQKVSKETMQIIANNLKNYLIQHDTNILLNTIVSNIKTNNDSFIIETNNKVINSKKVIISTGRSGGLFLHNISKTLNLKYTDNQFTGEIGIRIEMPYHVFDKVNNIFNDIKLKRKIDENNEIRTFCQNYRGILRKCVYKQSESITSSLDGCILGNESSGTLTNSVNIAIHHRFNNINNINEMYRIVRNANKNNKPIAQSLKGFMQNENTFDINSNICTFIDYEIDNINEYLPKNSLNYIKKMIIDIDKVLPGFANDTNVVYAPSFEFGMDKYLLNKNLETNLNGLYIGGDATGHFRGMMQAMVSALIIGADIDKKLEVTYE